MAIPIPISQLTPGTVKSTDIYPATDITDTTQAATGTTKAYTIAQLAAYISANPGPAWTVVTASVPAISALKYIANASTLITFTLPTSATVGYQFQIVGLGSGGWKILQNANQNIQIGNVSSTVGTGGSVASSNQYDAINLVCTVANTTWQCIDGPQGNITIV